MGINRLSLLARAGAVQFADTPDNAGGGGSDTGGQDDASQKGGDGDKTSDDSEEDSDEDEGEGEDSASKSKDDEDDKGGADGFTPITSQAELNKIIGKRIDRERAKFADYDQLKSENAQLKKDLLEERHGNLIRKVSEDTGVPGSLLRGTTEDELRAHAEEIKSFTSGRSSSRKPGHSPHTGTGSERPIKPSTDTGRERARAAAK